MKENGIMVDYEWAYKHVVLSHDFTEKSPSWVNAFVEGWRKGYLCGYIRGRIEGVIEVVCRMIKNGLSAESIAQQTGLSLDVIEMIVNKGDNSTED